ncbi:MAG: signal peptidase II [Alphaproteobacteria bacterium]|jgi:signal peptidase II|nr:signal peptidase II [Alphaproteobacteria bacterium]MBT4084514.1 signal peptidase II [Alphaproteobacteria bacterium]MBT4545384.1 signal peptidase II [Alphaproteobacteria bacterium]MBT7745578.1 signal peptidase II [Alphaproteobacteria bacterium]
MLRYGLVIAAVCTALDQASKWWLMGVLERAGGPIELLPFFNLVMVWNPGVSFGMFQSGNAWAPWILSALALVIVFVLVRWLGKAETRFIAAGLGLVIGGALGNVIDRMVWGKVADFFDVYIDTWHWPAFNIADAAIVIGAAILLLDGLFASRGRDT